jgi:hypothetical protein
LIPATTTTTGITVNRSEHLAWAKERALEYLPDDPDQAATSFISDLAKHPDTSGHVVIEMLAMHAAAGLWSDGEVRRLVEGTN